jgi:hypothetical protein
VFGVTGAALDEGFDESIGVVPAFGGEVTEASDLPLPLLNKPDLVGNVRFEEEEMK